MTRRSCLLVIAATYGLALATPAFVLGMDDQTSWYSGMKGLGCLIFVPGLCFTRPVVLISCWFWWANPLLLIGCILLVKRMDRAARWIGFLAFLLSVSFAFLDLGNLKDLRIGYFLWMSSMASLFMATYLPHQAVPPRKPDKIHELDDLLEPIGVRTSASS